MKKILNYFAQCSDLVLFGWLATPNLILLLVLITSPKALENEKQRFSAPCDLPCICR